MAESIGDKNNHVGEKIRHFRTLKGWTLQELHEVSGVSRTYLGELERGVSQPTATVLKKIADAFRVPIEMFFEETNLLPVQTLEEMLPPDVQRFLRDQKGITYLQLAIKAAEFQVNPDTLSQIIDALRNAEKIEKSKEKP